MSKLNFLDRFKPGTFPSEMIHSTIDKALNDENHFVRIEAARNSNATKENLDKALRDKHEDVRVATTRNPNATKEHLDKALRDKIILFVQQQLVVQMQLKTTWIKHCEINNNG